MFTCVLEIEGKKGCEAFVVHSHFDKSLHSASFVPGNCRYKQEQDTVFEGSLGSGRSCQSSIKFSEIGERR